jgi:hypothetical protein
MCKEALTKIARNNNPQLSRDISANRIKFSALSSQS